MEGDCVNEAETRAELIDSALWSRVSIEAVLRARG